MTLFDSAGGLPMALALRIGIIVVTLLLSRQRQVARQVAFLGSALASGVTWLTAANVLRAGSSVHGVLLVHEASGFVLTYTVDGLSAWFLVVLSVLAVPIALFSLGYVGLSNFSRRSVFIGAAFNILLGALETVFVADGVILFIFAWELMTLVSAALVATGHEERANRRAAYLDRSCPTGAIQTATPAHGRRTLSLSYAACIQCRECVTRCPEQAVSVSSDVEVAAYSRPQLARTASFDVDPTTDRGTFRQVEVEPGLSLSESAARLRERIRGRLGRSLHVRMVDAGSCNACELEIAATTNPIYDLERFGIHLVASPRHADVLLVTGPVTRNMEIALRTTYDAAPEPRVVVVVGACWCGRGIFGEDTYAAVGGVDRVVPVDVYIPGCPPRPQAILNGLLVAMGVREARVSLECNVFPS
jgi:Ni,Fe-hydrogenase III small subunit/NAD-dependent dihydropyrimidine dehydrogenase PreA subunit